MAQRQRAQRQRARQRARAQRQREKTRRQKARQEQRTRRQTARQQQRTARQTQRALTRQERVRQKGASGFYTPEGIRARGQVASDLVGQGIEIAGMVATGGASAGISALGDRRGAITDIFTDNGVIQDENLAFTGSQIGGGGGGFDIAPIEEEKPFYTNPIFIGGALVGGFLLYRQFTK